MDIPGTRREIARWLNDSIQSLGLNPILVMTVIAFVWTYLMYRKMDSWKEADPSEKRWVILTAFLGAAGLFAVVAQWITS